MAAKEAQILLRLMPPQDDEFFGGDFMPCEAFESLAADLIGRYDELQFLSDYTLRFLWKRNGGKRSGRPILGKCVAPAGLLRFCSGADWIVWFAADYVRSGDFNAGQVEALFYHELLHCALTDDEKRKPITRSHDLEIFNKEIERYGLWMDDLRESAKVMQLRMELGTE